MHQQKTKSIDHLLSSCPILIPIEYKEKHDWGKWYKYQPEKTLLFFEVCYPN